MTCKITWTFPINRIQQKFKSYFGTISSGYEERSQVNTAS